MARKKFLIIAIIVGLALAIISFIGGFGGRDISPAGFKEIVNRGIDISKTGSEQEFEIFGVRE